MESKQFDELTRKLASPVSRRTAVKAVLVTAVGSAFGLNKIKDSLAANPPACGTGQTACTNGRTSTCCTNVIPNGVEVCCHNQTSPSFGRCVVCSSASQINQKCQCCPAGSTACKTTCVTCSITGQTVDPSNCLCRCPAGQVVCGNSCVTQCPVGTHRNPDTCLCECTLYGCGSDICCHPGKSCVGATDSRRGECVEGTCPTPQPAGPAGSNCFNSCVGVPSSNAPCYCVTVAEGGVQCVRPICTGTPCDESDDCKRDHMCITQGCCGATPTNPKTTKPFAGFCGIGCGHGFISGGIARPSRRWGKV